MATATKSAEPPKLPATRATIRQVVNGYIVASDGCSWNDDNETIHADLDSALDAVRAALTPPAPKPAPKPARKR